MKLVILDGFRFPGETFPEPLKIAKDNGFEMEVAAAHDDDEAVEAAKDADGMIVVYLPISGALLERLPKLKVMVRTGVGYDNFDLPGATKAGVLACNVPDYGYLEVATSATAMLLALERKLLPYTLQIKQGNWSDAYGYPTYRLNGRVCGFVGFGRIARQAAKYVTALGYTVKAYDPYLPKEAFAENGAEGCGLDEVLTTSDAIILMAPLTPETHHVINKDSLARMKDEVLIINTARGPLVKTEDLYEALVSGKVRGAALDVLEGEPIKDPSFPLWSLENVIATPHAAYRSVESFINLKSFATEALVNMLSGRREPYYVVNPDVLKGPNRLSAFLKK